MSQQITIEDLRYVINEQYPRTKEKPGLDRFMDRLEKYRRKNRKQLQDELQGISLDYWRKNVMSNNNIPRGKPLTESDMLYVDKTPKL